MLWGGTLVVNVVDSNPNPTDPDHKKAVLALRSSGGNYWLDRTWQEISDAFPNVIMNNPFDIQGEGNTSEKLLVTRIRTVVYTGSTFYEIGGFTGGANYTFLTESADGYPIYD